MDPESHTLLTDRQLSLCRAMHGKLLNPSSLSFHIYRMEITIVPAPGGWLSAQSDDVKVVLGPIKG